MATFLQGFSLGDYASYIGSAYGIVFISLIITTFSCHWQKKKINKLLAQWLMQTK